MNSENFEQALLDLYDVYNPSKKKDVKRLVSNYNGREYDAIKTILIRYNFKGHPAYNENANRDDYVNYIINNYSEGNRVLSKENRLKESKEEELKRIKEEQELKKEKEQKIEEEKDSLVKLGKEVKQEIKKEIEELTKGVKDLIEQKTKKINDYFESKNIEFAKREELLKDIEGNVLNHSGNTIVNEVIKTSVPHTRVNIENINFTDADLKLPSEEVLESVSKGTRLIVKTSEGRVCGIEVEDVTYDLISYEGEVVKEIILKRI
jgi:hypothetical protein